MAEENAAAQTEGGTGRGAPATDWRAEYEKAVEQSRKWESRSKANAEKAKAYDELAAKSMTDAERAEQAGRRAEKAEAELERYKAEARRAKDAAEVSSATGVPASLLTASDRKGMEAQATAIKEYAEGRPSSQVFEADGRKPGSAKKDPMADFANELFGIR